VELDPKYRIFGESLKSIEMWHRIELVLVFDELRFDMEYFFTGSILAHCPVIMQKDLRK
jgi:hypothetical protein